jgi:hypothetical protein
MSDPYESVYCGFDVFEGLVWARNGLEASAGVDKEH